MCFSKLLASGIIMFCLLAAIPAHAQECIEFWVCSDWSYCLGSGIRMRTCTDINRCGTSDTKPAETQNCTPVQPREVNLPENTETGGVTGLLVTNTPTILGILTLALLAAVYLMYKKWKDMRTFISSP
jgi:hypothetical protein